MKMYKQKTVPIPSIQKGVNIQYDQRFKACIKYSSSLMKRYFLSEHGSHHTFTLHFEHTNIFKKYMQNTAQTPKVEEV